MSGFSSVTLTGNYGSAAVGTLTFLLQQPMMNSAVTVIPSPIIISLASGAFSQSFNANNDIGTVPSNVYYGVTEELANSPVSDYFICIPPIRTETNGSTTSGSEIVQLSSITATDDMVGQSITGAGIPSGAYITAVQLPVPQGEIFNYPFATDLNTVTISASATATAKALTLTLGQTIDISRLRPGALGWA